MTRRGGSRRAALLPLLGALLAACAGATSTAPDGADLDRSDTPSMTLVAFTDVAPEVGLDFRHGAFRWETGGDPNAIMGGGLCWIDVDDDGWLDLFAVNTWSNGEWGRWREEGELPTSRLYRNDAGTFTDVTAEFGAGVETRGSGCVAADLDLDGHTDLYVTSERQNVLLWNVGGDRFEADDGTAGINTSGWQAGAAVADVNRDGWPDLFVAGYADLNRRIPEATRGFPNTYVAEPDLLYLSGGGGDGVRPGFTDVAVATGIESDRVDYGLGAIWSDVDRDGDPDLYVANDTQPNRLYMNEPTDDDIGFRLVDVGPSAGVADDNAGMGVAIGDFDADGLSDIVETNLGSQGHRVFRNLGGAATPSFESALDAMGLPDLGQGLTGWGTTWVDVDLDGDLDLLIAHGAIPVRDLDADRQQLQLFENLTADGRTAEFEDATEIVGLDRSGRHLARGLAAADYDNDGDVDLAVGTIGGDLALLRNTGAGGHWLLVAPDPAQPGTIVRVTSGDGASREREIIAGSSYLSSEDPRAHFGLGAGGGPVHVEVLWPDGSTSALDAVTPDRIVAIGPG